MSKGNKVTLAKPGILTWAREELHIDVPTAAAHFKKTEAIINAWESGDESPTYNQLKDLANYYKRPIAIFFLPSVPPKSPKPLDHRTLSGVTEGEFSKETLLAYREVSNMLLDARELFEELKTKVVFNLPYWTLSDEPDLMANHLRNILGISIESQIKLFKSYSDAQNAWRDKLFDHGVIVRICEMPITDARAFCLFGNNLAGIGLSNEDKEHGRIFSLFHEVCHLTLKQPGVSGIMTNRKSDSQALEQYCDRFSASFLLPPNNDVVRASLDLFKGSTIDYLEVAKHIADKFKVSKYVAIRRAFDLGIVPESTYWGVISNWKKFDVQFAKSQKAGFGNYNVTQISHMGNRFVSLVMQAFEMKYLTSVDARRILGISPSTIESM
jgi:Zn-dependent peptidase ImmA (M78 family)